MLVSSDVLNHLNDTSVMFIHQFVRLSLIINQINTRQAERHVFQSSTVTLKQQFGIGRDRALIRTSPVCHVVSFCGLAEHSPVQPYWHAALLLATEAATATLLWVEISKLQMGRKWKE